MINSVFLTIFNKQNTNNMKTILALIALALVSCSSPEIQSNNQQSSNYDQSDCGIIMSATDNPSGDQIAVKMDYQSGGQRSIYQVPDYRNYQVGSKICNFEGLIKLQ